MRRVSILVSGLVQGVGFRYYSRKEAESLRLAGYVRNKADGSVEIEAQGTPEAIDRFLEWVKHGPKKAVVENIISKELEVFENEKDFEIK
jgi:acylphosphatase